MALQNLPLAPSWRALFPHDGVFVGPRWLPWAWTLVFAAVIAVGFTILGFFAYGSGEGAWHNWRGWLTWYRINLVISLSVGVTIRLLFALLIPWVGPARIRRFGNLQRAVFFTSVPMLGVLLGGPLGLWLSGRGGRPWFGSGDPGTVAGSVLVALLISTIIFLVFNAKARQIDAERRATEAKLRLLQGQIEPHFLFNTLANVISLIDHDSVKAKRMLESFTDYLRSSLSSLRRDSATLGSELDLVQAYLGVLKTRMEDRLQFDIDTDPALRAARLPPLLLQPLVENAIHHGIEAKVDGGRVRVSARLDGPTLVLEVRDDGLGLAAPPRRAGAGMALANLRQRLRAQYSDGASLALVDAHPGTVATLRLPYEKAANS